jgi:hypothetical protein
MLIFIVNLSSLLSYIVINNHKSETISPVLSAILVSLAPGVAAFIITFFQMLFEGNNTWPLHFAFYVFDVLCLFFGMLSGAITTFKLAEERGFYKNKYVFFEKASKIGFNILIVLLIIQMCFFIGVPYWTEMKLNNDTKFVEWKTFRAFIFCPFGDNGAVILQPFPSCYSRVFDRKIVHDEKIIAEYNYSYFNDRFDIFKYALSPNGQYMLVYKPYAYEDETFEIHDLNNYKTVKIKAPANDEESSDYKFIFKNWSNDSKSFFAIIEKTVDGPKWSRTELEQTWQVYMNGSKNKLILEKRNTKE